MNNLDLASCELDMVIFAAHIMLPAINEGLPVLNLQAKRFKAICISLNKTRADPTSERYHLS